MPVGGKRPGAGRKPGAAWKGKTPRPSELLALGRKRVRGVLKTAQDPLAVLVDIANDDTVDVQTRVAAAAAAAPFIFPRLSASVVATAPMSARDDGAGLVERLMQRIAKMAPPVAETIEGKAEPATVGAD